jgi:hypothetical protein
MTYILSDRLDYASIISALENKDFYATTGPRIFSLGVEEGTIRVKTDEAERILFITNNHHRKAVLSKSGEHVTQAEFTVSSKDKWVRVEVVGFDGKRAFTRAFSQDELF